MATPKYLSGAYEAQEISTRLNVAFFMEATAPAVAADHYAEGLRKFEELALKLGYRVEKIVAVETMEAAE